MRTLALLLLLAPLAASGQDDVDHLIGRPYAGLPGGWAGTGGAVLESALDGDTYLLSSHENVHDGSHLFTYARVDQMIDDRYPVSTVLAALVVSDVREGEAASSFACTAGRNRPAVVVVAAPTLDEADGVYRYGPVRLAWVLDRAAGRFEPVGPEAVVCADKEAY